MAGIIIPDNPEINLEMEQVTDNTYASSENMNGWFGQLLQNDAAIKERTDNLGRVLVGPANTTMGHDDILFIVDEVEGFRVAGISNMELGTAPPVNSSNNWGKVTIVDGILTAAARPEENTTFFAQLGEGGILNGK